MRSNGKQRQPKISRESYLPEEAVNPPGTVGVPSFPTAQLGTQPCGDRTDLMEMVVERSNMLRALRRVEENKGAPGVDGMKVEELRPYLKEHWPRLREKLLAGNYQPMPVRRVEIPKPDGGVRLLGIPTALDRLIQQAHLQILTPLFDPGFSEYSYGFRPGRSTHQAVKKAQEYIRQGYRYVVDIDLEKFFDQVNHDILMARVARKAKDKRVLRLIRRYLEAGIMLNGCCIRTEKGTPQGGPLSPLLANIILDDLDKELERRGHKFVRYADDSNVYVKSQRAGLRVMDSIRRFVEGRLKLKINLKKSAVDRPWKRKFLGFSFTVERESRIRIAQQSIKRFKDKVRELTSRSRGISLKERLERLNTYLRGWMGYFRLTQAPSVLEALDEWIRRRLRMCLLKQWKKPATKRRKLVALGIPKEWAQLISRSRKGYWRLANTPQVNKALGLSFWKNQGLMSLVERYEVR